MTNKHLFKELLTTLSIRVKIQTIYTPSNTRIMCDYGTWENIKWIATNMGFTTTENGTVYKVFYTNF